MSHLTIGKPYDAISLKAWSPSIVLNRSIPITIPIFTICSHIYLKHKALFHYRICNFCEMNVLWPRLLSLVPAATGQNTLHSGHSNDDEIIFIRSIAIHIVKKSQYYD